MSNPSRNRKSDSRGKVNKNLIMSRSKLRLSGNHDSATLSAAAVVQKDKTRTEDILPCKHESEDSAIYNTSSSDRSFERYSSLLDSQSGDCRQCDVKCSKDSNEFERSYESAGRVDQGEGDEHEQDRSCDISSTETSTKGILEGLSLHVCEENKSVMQHRMTSVSEDDTFIDVGTELCHSTVASIDNQSQGVLNQADTSIDNQSQDVLNQADTSIDNQSQGVLNQADTSIDNQSQDVLNQADTSIDNQSQGVLNQADTSIDNQSQDVLNQADTSIDNQSQGVLNQADTSIDNQSQDVLNQADTLIYQHLHGQDNKKHSSAVDVCTEKKQDLSTVPVDGHDPSTNQQSDYHSLDPIRESAGGMSTIPTHIYSHVTTYTCRSKTSPGSQYCHTYTYTNNSGSQAQPTPSNKYSSYLLNKTGLKCMKKTTLNTTFVTKIEHERYMVKGFSDADVLSTEHTHFKADQSCTGTPASRQKGQESQIKHSGGDLHQGRPLLSECTLVPLHEDPVNIHKQQASSQASPQTDVVWTDPFDHPEWQFIDQFTQNTNNWSDTGKQTGEVTHDHRQNLSCIQSNTNPELDTFKSNKDRSNVKAVDGQERNWMSINAGRHTESATYSMNPVKMSQDSEKVWMSADGRRNDINSYKSHSVSGSAQCHHNSDVTFCEKNENKPSGREHKTEYISCLQALKMVADQEGLEIVDVCPDGNCLFGAVVDQLNVRGHFYYTPKTLREAAVQYLRINPTQEDGTHLHEFLPGDTWDNYLYMMSREGQWADHVIISAIPKLLGRRLLILGGATGTSCTVIEPENREPDNRAPDNREPGNLSEDGCGMDDKACTSKSLHRAVDGDDLVIGHIPESHYLSVRRKNWLDTFLKSLMGMQNACFLKDDEQDSDHVQVLFPQPHLNFLMRYILRSHLIYMLPVQSSVLQHPLFEEIAAGGRFSYLATGMNGSRNTVNTSCCMRMNDIYTMVTVHDTQVIFDGKQAKKKDLHAIDIPGKPGHLYLQPNCPEVWKPCVQEQDGMILLKHLGQALKYSQAADVQQSSCHDRCLAFSCPWPSVAEEWMYRHRQGNWPTDHHMTKVVNMVRVVQSDSVKSASKTTWMYCFDLAEQLICKQLRQSIKRCLGLVCALFEFALQEEMPMAFYRILKSVFFYMCEEMQTLQAPGECIMTILTSLYYMLYTGNVCDYFIKNKNLLEDLEKPERYINITLSIRKHIVAYMFGLFHHQGLQLSLTLQKIYYDLLADARLFHAHGQRAISWMCFNRMYIIEAQEYAKSGHHVNAYNTIHNMLQDAKVYPQVEDTNVYLDQVMAEIIRGLPLQEQWMLSFYIDQQKGTNILQTVCSGRNCIPLERLFGEQFTEVLKSLNDEYGHKGTSQDDSALLVPCEIFYQETELSFVQQVAKILQWLRYDDAYLSALHYYLKKNTDSLLQSLEAEFRESGNNYFSRTAIVSLKQLYKDVYYTYYDNNQLQCFRDLMDSYRLLSFYKLS